MDAESIPVLVGVGQVNDRPADPTQGLSSIELMAEALRRADVDAGSGWLSRIDRLAAVRQISMAALHPAAARVADTLGLSGVTTEDTAQASGDSPIRLLDEAANAIASGQARVVAVTGGEALRTAAAQARAQGAEVNAMRAVATRREPNYTQLYGLTAPVDVYPLYENACRAAWGQTLAEGQAESGAIWSCFSQVAAANDSAWLNRPATLEEITTPTAGNRPIAFPYTKLMVANSSVNQGAGFLVTSLAEARRASLSDDRIVHIGLGAAAAETDAILARDRFDASASMAAALEATMAANRLTAADLAHAELYSCFPCVPKMARRILGWPVERPATVFGGLTFGGGPIANYMSHAVAEMVLRLRAATGRGLLFANGGYATHNHAIILGSEPLDALRPHAFDVQPVAEARRRPVPSLDRDYAGGATVETYTVFYGRSGEPTAGVVVARTPAGARTLAAVPAENAEVIAALTDGAIEPVGRTGIITKEGERARWHF